MTETRPRRTLAECLLNGGVKGITFRRSSLLGTKEGSEPRPIPENYSYLIKSLYVEVESEADSFGRSNAPYHAKVLMHVNFKYPTPTSALCSEILLSNRLDDLEWFESDSREDIYRDEELIREGNSWRKK